MYESTAMLLADEKSGRTVELSRARAAQALRLCQDTYRWAETQDDPLCQIRENTRITSQDGMVKIQVRSTNKFMARDLALELSWLFRGMDEEERIASEEAMLWPLSSEEEDLLMDRETVERLMNEESREAGCNTVFRAVPTLISRGSQEAKDLWEMESFRLRWDFYEKATWEIAGEPHSDLPPLPLAHHPGVAAKPVSPNVVLYQFCGLLAGLIIGGVIGFPRCLRVLEIPPSKRPVADSDSAYVESLPSASEQGNHFSSPEAEW